MRKLLILLLVFPLIIFSQTKDNAASLKTELDSIYKVDQNFRRFINNSSADSSLELNEFLKEQGYTLKEFRANSWPIIDKHDKLNLERIEEIIKKYGYPGKSLVGYPTNEVVWYVIQHSKKIKEYLPIIENASKNGELKFTLVAMMQDRQLMFENKEQIYGTQGSSRLIKKDTGEEEYKWFIWPIKNPEKINELRKSTGFTSTIEEYSKQLSINYKVYTLEQVKNLDFN
ncbi:hypothetical protein KO506_04945 [Polaribacter vadi]|uniref:DUF6624 domain-containing protein n=1 Tax=Polaribacter TaxID=52959 RepID=UPI001C0A45C8|nr:MULTISPECIES: DUF6624 domain-containing protein [Polaribacter]MBU3010736.1 hypothetical protein [Polaribacter vadi]MDO6740547.1 hypothetical protein [Polaribacter sp. 1_MG-2023]